jgi:hypothetical protein
MTSVLPLRLAAASAVALTLTACVDAEVSIDVLSETTARATMIQTMSAEFYPMVAQATAPDDPERFCAEGDLVENADGGATCTISEEGAFDDLGLGVEGEDDGISFTPAGPGLVRVAIDTTDMAAEVGATEDLDAETLAMMEGFFTGHAITIRIGGGTVTETNMEEADGAAQLVIPLMDLVNGTVDFPDEIYAIVRVN